MGYRVECIIRVTDENGETVNHKGYPHDANRAGSFPLQAGTISRQFETVDQARERLNAVFKVVDTIGGF